MTGTASLPEPFLESSKLDELGQLRPTLVRASAGTGKTYQLTARLMRILFQGASPETVLATTFTRKAASEILQRVLITLAEASDPNHEEALERLRQQVKIPSLPRSACLQLLSRLMHNIHRLRVCTLDSLFSQLARSFPFELGLPAAWRLLDEMEERWTRERAVDALIVDVDPTEMSTLLAMLGKGDVQRSIAREMLTVVDLAYNQQRGTVADVWDRLRVPSAPESVDLTRAAGHLFQADPPQKSVKAKLQCLAEALESRLLGPLEQDTLLLNYARAKRTGDAVTFGRSRLPDGLDEALELLYGAVQTEVLSLLRAQNEATGRLLRSYDAHLRHLRQTARALAFDDVAIRLAETFQRLDPLTLASRMDGSIDHVLLDEFQDTSPVQWAVLRYFAKRSADRPEEAVDELQGLTRSFFCVGDTKQAIYSWRGGVAEIFDTVTEEIAGVEEVQQNLSFRSSPVILDLVTRTFQNLGRHAIVAEAKPGELADRATYEAEAIETFAARFPVHLTEKRQLPGYVRFETACAVEVTDDSEVADAAKLSPQDKCLEHAAGLVEEIHREFPERTIGVLTRTNSAVARLIYHLTQAGLSVSQEGGNPLIDSAAVEVVLSALMLAEHPSDGRWFFHLSNTPLLKHLDPDGGLSGLELAQKIRLRVEHNGLVATLFDFGRALTPVATDHDSLRLRQLTQIALDYELRGFSRLRDFVRLVREKRVERPQPSKIRVMTVHQAKGLEFDAVVLPELDCGLTRQGGQCIADRKHPSEAPHALSRYLTSKSWHYLPETWQRAFGRQSATEMTEALCLLYVAMTRARQALYMVIPIQSNKKFSKRTPASLIYHALELDADPTVAQTLYEAGNSRWGACDDAPPTAPVRTPEPLQRRVELRPLPPVPRRNRPDLTGRRS